MKTLIHFLVFLSSLGVVAQQKLQDALTTNDTFQMEKSKQHIIQVHL